MKTLGDRCIDELVRRIRLHEPLTTDLVLVRAHPALDDSPPVALINGDTWRIAKVTGELTLRDALPGAGRVVAIVPKGFVPAADVMGRCWLRRPLDLRPDDLVAGLTGRPCEAIGDEALAATMIDALDLLRAHADRFSLHGPVTAAEIRAVLISATLGADTRLDREADWVLLSRWIHEGLPKAQFPDLLGRALIEAHPRTGRFLAWAATTGNVPALVAAGALDDTLAVQVADVPSPRSTLERQDLRSLVDQAVRDAFRLAPERARAALAVAERVVHQAGHADADPARMPLVQGALDRAIHAAAQQCLSGKPPEDSMLSAFGASVHAGGAARTIAQLRDVARLGRATALLAPSGADVTAWGRFARDHVAWIDLAIRRVRRATEAMPDMVQQASRAAISQVLARRDAWNRAFALRLAADWPKVTAQKELADGIGLHQVTKCVVAPLLAAGHRVLLVVLDGCDLSTFLEMLLDAGAPVGLKLPELEGSAFRDALVEAGELQVAVSPVPTITNHSRRALFAGDIPKDSALQESELGAPNSAADLTAFTKNSALANVSRRLLLKGDLGDGQPLIELLIADHGVQLVATVFNAIDDALSSKETTPLGQFTFAALGVRAAEALTIAASRGWTILLTADHGHTPCLGAVGSPGSETASRKVSSSALGQRFDGTPNDAAVAFEAGPLPRTPLHLLTAVGAWHGQQHRGFHGGAGLEEVFVPLAFLGHVGEGEGRPAAPAWWWSGAPEVTTPLRSAATGPGSAHRAATVPQDISLAVASIARAGACLEALVRFERASAAELAAAVEGTRPFTVQGVMSTVLATLGRRGIPAPFVEETVGDQRQYRWVHRKD